jgi:hypothetical protein
MHLDISYTRIPLESILKLNPIKAVPISYISYGRHESDFFYGDDGRKERERIRMYIEGYRQILFCHPYLGLVDNRDPNHPLTMLSKEHASLQEISKVFKRGVTVDRLTSDESIAQFRAEALEIPLAPVRRYLRSIYSPC